MSEYLCMESSQVAIKDQEILLETLKEFGFDKNKIEIHENAVELHGYRGDERIQKAHIIIRKRYLSSASNDIGFEKKEDGTYKVWVSDFDRNRGFGQQVWSKQFFQGYAKKVVEKWGQKHKATIKCQKEKKKLKLTLRL